MALAVSLTRGYLVQPLAGFLRGREECTRTIAPARALAAEALTLEVQPWATSLTLPARAFNE